MNKKSSPRKKNQKKEVIRKESFPKTYELLQDLKELLKDKEVYRLK